MTAAHEMFEGRPAWQASALCAQTDPEAFFPEKGGSTRDARTICTGCEVKAECLAYALDHDERFGVWGGLTERQRRRLRHAEPTPPKERDRQEQDQRILALVHEGLTAPQIAERLGLRGPHVVYDTRRRHGIAGPPRARQPTIHPAPKRQEPRPALAAVPDPPKAPAPATAPEPRPLRPWAPSELAAAVAACLAAGLDVAEIAHHLGVSRANVRRNRRP